MTEVNDNDPQNAIFMNYGLLSYTSGNIGDVIQSLAARRFLPRVDILLDRDTPETWHLSTITRIILNGWFKHRPEDWPIRNARVHPLLISFHVSDAHGSSHKHLLSNDAIEFYKTQGPVGCRDLATKALLSSVGVDAYFSGCLTLTLEKRTTDVRNTIVLTDVPNGIRAHLPANHDCDVISVTHRAKSEHGFAAAASLLDLYSSARLVLTSRLHCAMPCLAFGTPVVLIRDSFEDPRFTGLKELCCHCSTSEILTGAKTLTFDMACPNHERILAMRSALVARCSEFISLGL